MDRQPALELALVQTASELGCPRSPSPYPVSMVEKWSCWFSERFTPDDPPYCVSVSGVLDIPLDPRDIDYHESERRFGPQVGG